MNLTRSQKERLADYFQKFALLVLAGTFADREVAGIKILLGALASGMLVTVSLLVDTDDEGG